MASEMRVGSGLRCARAFGIGFGILLEDRPHEDCRTGFHDEFVMSDTTESWSSVLQSWCVRSSKDMPMEMELDLSA
jgi:hypothetical protein